MCTENYRSILKRVGLVLISVGLIDIGVMIYCIVRGISYSSGLNIFAVIAGILLFRGSLKAASWVRWFAAFFLTIGTLVPFLLLFIQPVGLTFTEFHLYTGAFLQGFAEFAVLLVLFGWVVRELSGRWVNNAYFNAGIQAKPVRGAIFLGVALVLILGGIFFAVSRTGISQQAEELAAKQLGNGYKYFVTSMNVSEKGNGTTVAAVVTAWNRDEIHKISVQWKKK